MKARMRALAAGRAGDWAYRAGLGGPITLAWRALQGGEALRQELDVRRALGTLRRQQGFLQDGAELEDGRRPLLIVSLANWLMQVKSEAMLAKALQLRGLSPIALTSHRYVHAREFFRAFGVRRFVDLEDFARTDDADLVDADARTAFARLTDFPSMMAYQYRGTYVGRHVLSTICRTLRHGTPALASPEVQVLLRRLIPEAMHTALRGERALAALQPHTALFLERGYTPYGELYDVAINAGVNTVQWVGAHINEALIVRRCTAANRHDHPFSLADETWEDVKARPWTPEQDAAIQREFDDRYQQGAWFMRQRLQDGKRVKTVDEVRAQLGLDPAKPTAVVFSHLFWDATFFFGEDLFDTYEQWLVETVRAACRNPGVNWVIKLHPANIWKLKRENAPLEFVEEVALREQVGPLPPHVVLVRPQTDINTYSFFQLMDYCLTVRGTIGMEAPCYGIPVLTAGTGRYSGRGFTIDSNHRAEYLARLARIQDIPRLGPAQIELARRHAYALFKLRPLPISSFRLVYPGVDTPSHPLDHDVEVRVESTSALRAATDLATFASWAVDSKRLDYIVPEAKAANVAGAHEIRWTPEHVARIWDYYSGNRAYEAQYFSRHSGSYVLDTIGRHLPLSGRHVVDFGCGPGFMLEHLLARGIRCSGLDFSTASVDAARARFGDHPLFGGVSEIKGVPLAVADGAIDVLMLIEVLEHVLEEDFTPTLRELVRVVRPGGHLIVAVPHAEDLEASKTMCPACGCVFHRWQHQRSLTAPALDAAMRTAGLETVVCLPTRFGPTSVLDPLRRLRRRWRGSPEPMWPHLLYIGRKAEAR